MEENQIYVRVTGKTIPKKELEIYFQSRKQSGGGDIRSIEQINDEESIIAFEEKEVARNVSLRTHSIDGARVEVSTTPFSGDNFNAPTNQDDVVIIRGLSENTTKDALQNYLENTKRSGGGAVEEVRITGNSAWVKFESAEVTNRVVQREKHTLNGVTLDVSLEVSDKDKDVEKTIKITGLAAKTTKDSILNYFENKRRSGGGEVENVDFRSDTGVAFVTFVDVNVANRVVQHGKLTLNGATLDVSLEVSDKDKDVEKTIKITGLAAKTTKDSILNYFENKRRSGGGEVESVDFGSDTGVAFVTFVDVNVVSSVLQRAMHSLDGADLTVILSSSSCALSDKEELPESRVIEVTGLASSTTKDAIINFFENTRRSGGGDIENVECHPDKGLAVITFLSVDSAQGVLNKQNLTLDDAELKVTLRKAAKKLPIDTMRLLVKGLSEKTTQDGLISYMEVISEFQEVSDVEFGEQGCALVTFSEEYDYETITKKAAKRLLEGNMLAIEKVPVCSCIQVTGLNKENTTEDTVRYYFEHPKNGGGDVSHVELHIKEGWALVYFEEPQVVTTVTAKSHVLNRSKLEVKIHNPAIAKPISHPEEHEVEMEQQVPVNPQVMLFICEQHQDDLTQLKDKHAVRVTWEEGASNVTLAPEDNTSKDKERFHDTTKVITSFFDAFLTTTIPVMPDAWQNVVQSFKDSSSSINATVKIQYLDQQHEIALTGRKEDVEALAEKLQVLKTKVEKQVALEASKKTQIVPGVPPKCMKFLCDLEFDKKLEGRYENTEVEVDLDKDEVKIRGPPDTIQKTAAAVWEVAAKMRDVSLKVSQNVVGVLRKDECQSFIKKEFMTRNVQATIAFSEDDENLDTVVVMGLNSEAAQTASRIVKNLVTEKCLVLDEGQVQLEKSEKWRILKEELSEKFILSIAFNRNNNELALAGKKEDISAAERSITRFFKENTIVSEVVELPQGCRRFLVKYREQDLRQIQEELNELSTVTKGMAGGHDEDVIVSGTADGVKRGVNMIRDLASTVESQKVPVDKPGMRKALDRSKGKKMLGLIENENKCIIEYFNSDKDASLENAIEEEKEESKKTKQCEYSFSTPEGKKISVFKDDICNRNVDVIVNAANTQLQHSTGVAKAIVDAGGKTIQDECDRYIMAEGSILEGQVVVTTAGKMSFKKVIHAVGPFWRKEATREKSIGKTPREEKLLRFAVSNALDAASAFTSVALPAISTGAFEFPHDLCANIMVDATLAFSEENPACRLSEIQFTTTNDAVLTAFVKEMNTRVAQDPNLRASSKAKDTPKVMGKGRGKSKGWKTPTPSPAPVSTDGPTLLTTAEGLKLVLVVGDMTREEVDAIVNSTSSDLDLSRNASSQALSAAAGPTLQQECKAIGQVQTGGLAVTGGGDLGCKHVFHTSCSGWENGKGEQVLRDIVKKSLNEAQRRNLLSIAIPAIGTGNLQFPHDRVAAASFDEVVSFSKKNPNSTIKEVHLVVYDKDLSSVQAFQTELQNLKGNKPQSPAPADSVNKKRRKLRGAAAKTSDSDDSFDVIDEKEAEELDPLQPEISIGSITVQAETGDITKEATDAIVTLSNTDLDVAFGGGVGKAILTAGGSGIQAECTSLGTQPAGAIVVTKAGRLQTRKIYHIVPGKPTMASLRDSMVKCLKLADIHGLTSISFPAIGTGNISVGVKESSEEMLAAIAKFAQEQPASLRLIRIVIYQQHMLAVFRNAMEACISSLGERGFISKIAVGIAGFFGFSKNSSPSAAFKKRFRGKDGRYLEIFAGTKQNIAKAIEEIQKDLAEQCLSKVIENEAIGKLSKDQKRKIMNLEAKHDDAVIKVEEPVGRISVKGDAEDVVDIASAIHEILNQQIEEEHTRGIGELLSKNVQWHYEDEHEGFTPYDTSINRQIEIAFADGQNSVIVLIDDCRCEIVFKDMKETCLDDGEERQVVRKEIGKGVPLPLEWSVQPKDSSGKEEDVHLVQLDPINQATEYNKVADEIKKTATITITKIERVQNPGLYRAYVVRKDQMDQKKGGNEKFLFHGTAQGSCSSINKFGFNRSYCGKNATVYGNGVYFARDASYSTQLTYSPVDASGNRYLYLARVLVGEFAVGRRGMLTPPPKGSDATDAYDSVVDNTSTPSIFVVFYDNQCYPDYLVTFK